jgi:hypothetical protein
LNRKSVPEVVQPRAIARARRPQARLPRQSVEGSVNAAEVEPRATIGNEHIVGGAVAEKLFASLKVVDQYGACGWMEGHETSSTELCRPDGEHSLLNINIIELEKRFG